MPITFATHGHPHPTSTCSAASRLRTITAQRGRGRIRRRRRLRRRRSMHRRKPPARLGGHFTGMGGSPSQRPPPPTTQTHSQPQTEGPPSPLVGHSLTCDLFHPPSAPPPAPTLQTTSAKSPAAGLARAGSERREPPTGGPDPNEHRSGH